MMTKSASLIPPLAELRSIYSEVINNSAVRSLSAWVEPNHSEMTDEEAYLRKALESGDELLLNMRNAVKDI
jgi:hypothetical protein